MRVLQLAFIVLTLASCAPYDPPPSDQSLIENFSKNGEVFDKLRIMICEDGYQTISLDPEWSEPESLSEDEKEKYYSLFRKIHIKQVAATKDCRVRFSVWSVGWAGSGDYKDYEYRPSKVGNVVDSLDQLPLNNTDIVFYYRKIDEEWYLSYKHWP